MDANLTIAILIIIAAPAIAIGALLFVRRTAPNGGYFNDGDRAAGVFGVLATGFSVLLGLIVVLAFSSFDESRSGAVTEAELVAQQYQTAQFFPESEGPDLAAGLVCYGRYVIHREWPQMEDGSIGDSTNPWGGELFVLLRETEPESASEQAAFSKWLDQTSERQTARQDRIDGAQGIIPNALWAVLILTSLVIFTFMLFFADSGERVIVQAVLIGTVITVLTATLFLIRFLESPYQSGLNTLQPVAMEKSLRIIDEISAFTEVSALPCDENGDLLEQ